MIMLFYIKIIFVLCSKIIRLHYECNFYFFNINLPTSRNKTINLEMRLTYKYVLYCIQ
jgi:hypothetical protein